MGSRCFALSEVVYTPPMRLILTITQANPAVVTTSFNGTTAADHGYVNGTIVRFDIPVACGMPELNKQFGPITVLSSTTFSIPYDTTMFEPFSIPDPITTPPAIDICAQVVPIGSENDTLLPAVVNDL